MTTFLPDTIETGWPMNDALAARIAKVESLGFSLDVFPAYASIPVEMPIALFNELLSLRVEGDGTIGDFVAGLSDTEREAAFTRYRFRVIPNGSFERLLVMRCMLGWSERQIMAARAIMVIEEHEPECPECGAGVLRPKCLYESDECPRHPISDRVRAMMHEIERDAELPRGWRQEMSIHLMYRVPSPKVLELLARFVEDGGSLRSPDAVEGMWPLCRMGVVSLVHKDRRYVYTLTDDGRDYLCDLAREGLWPVPVEASGVEASD